MGHPTIFNSISSRLKDWAHSPDNLQQGLHINGISPSNWSFIFQNFLNNHDEALSNKNHLVIAPSAELAEQLYQEFKIRNDFYVAQWQGLEISPYGGIIPSEANLNKRFKILSKLSRSEKKSILFTSIEALLLKTPPKCFFINNSIKIAVDETNPPDELVTKLVGLGYLPAPSVEEPGTFARKGEILDIYTIGQGPVRVHYFDDYIEAIFPIEADTQRSLRDEKLSEVIIDPGPSIFAKREWSQKLREAIPRPPLSLKDKAIRRDNVLNDLNSGRLFEEHAAFTPYFFEQTETLLSYLNQEHTLATFIESDNGTTEFIEYIEQLRENYESELNDSNSECLLGSPETIYENLNALTDYIPTVHLNELGITVDLDHNLSANLEIKIEKTKAYLVKKINLAKDKHTFISQFLDFIKENFKHSGHIIFSCSSENIQSEIKYLMENHEFPTSLLSRISFSDLELNEGFYYHSEKLFVISAADLFAQKSNKKYKKVSRNKDLFAEQLSTLTEGDFVIHAEHGIGIYKGLISLDHGGKKSDFVELLYDANDKIYVPVYNLNLIQKHAGAEAQVKPANLRSNKFKQAKNKARESAKKLAFDLLELQAKRESLEAYAFSPPDHLYKEFEFSFPFKETPDQQNAIDSVLEDMQKRRPMDHLVCGDVGFGKTEVAMRAAFKAVLDKKQVSLLVPTTVLALQHYNSFLQRFKDFAVNIEFLSRFKSPKEERQIKEQLALGEIDIIIGTHKLLSDSITYENLGLVIVDEEQRFGVNHKEKLKTLKSTVDFLTLTATPIPRTLQLAFLGLRDLSLIQTAPPKRQSVKTYIVRYDENILKQAIEKEINRGGQVFFVHNRVQDLEKYHQLILDLVPEAKVVVGHGQMPERELEKQMRKFYSGEANVLLSTTIIESGLDIPNANTMIVERADRFGLSQLHQLRGRIGRSDKKAYAYFVVPNDRNLRGEAERRLKSLQTYAEIGSGFSIASCDLEIRGAGDILGAEQSGHIDSIGLELYLELLKEAIDDIKGTQELQRREIEIQTPYNSFIPHTYIKNDGERIKQYKRLSNCNDLDQLSSYRDELIDIYGIFPSEVDNLLSILEMRILLQKTAISSIRISGKVMNIAFDQDLLNKDQSLQNKVVEFFISDPQTYRFTPDYKVIYTQQTPIKIEHFTQVAKIIAQKIVPC